MDDVAGPVGGETRQPIAPELLQQLSVAIQQGPLIVCVTDAAGRIEYINPRFTTATGYTLAELQGRTCRTLKSGDMSPAVYQRLWHTITSGSVWRGEFHNRRADGTTYWEQASIWPLRNAQGEITHFVKASEDITERKRAELALQESEDTLRRVFESSSDPILLLDGDVFIDCNQATVDKLGFASKDDVVGRHPWELSPDVQPDGTRSMDRAPLEIAAANARGTHQFEWAHSRADGSLLPAAITLTSITHGGRRVLHVTWRDLSDRRAAEAERERLQGQLAQAHKMEAIGRLAGGVAHDFNNMLGVIIGHADLALGEVEAESPLGRDLAAIREAAHRSAELTRQLLGFARRQTVQPRVLDLNEVIGGTRKMLGRLIGEEIDLQWEPGPGLWPVRMDPAQLDQVLANLTVNARDAISGSGSVTISTANVVLSPSFCAGRAGFVPGEYVKLEVRDTGAGMSEDALEHLFEPFFTTKAAGKGTGLGLATVYGIVRQNQGLIDVESEPGGGSSFRVYLPRSAGAPAAAADQAAAAPAGRAVGAETVLVVEDEAALLALTRMQLEQQGYTVLAARTPADAEVQLRNHAGAVHLLVTDVVMPGMNGRELAERLRAIRPGMRCLFMSGYPADVIATHGVLANEVRFIQKPFTSAALGRSVREALDG